MIKSKNKKAFFTMFLLVLFLPLLLCACDFGKKTDEKTVATLEIEDLSKVYDGNQVVASYQTNSDGVVTVEYKKSDEDEFSLVSPTDVGEYIVKVTVAESDLYSAVSQTKTFSITKATPNYTIPNTLGIVSGEKLESIDLSSYGLEWEEPQTVVCESGTFYATVLVQDTKNYNTLSGIGVEVEVVASTVSTPTVTNLSFDFDGEEHAPTLDYDSTQVLASGTFGATNAGTYEIVFERIDSNTAWSDGTTANKVISWTINAKSVAIPTLQTSFDFDESEKTISISDIQGFDESLMQIETESSTLTGTSAGTYKIVVSLKDKANSVWSDGTTTDKILSWTIVDSSLAFDVNFSEGTDKVVTITKDESTGEYVVKFTTISADSVYSISGNLFGHIEIDVGDDFKFELELNGVNIESKTTSPIQIFSADKVQITAKKNTTNTILDSREDVSEDETQYSSAIYATTDLVLGGKGTLNVTSTNNNGIHTKDDLEVKNLTLNVDCKDNALKGNDSVTVTSGTLTLIARQGDGIKTTNSNISSKSNQRGTVALESGSITIYSACDGIDASYDVTIADGVELNIFTDKYSSYSEEVTAVTSGTYYLKTTSTNYNYSIAYTTSSGTTWANASYYSSSFGGRGTTYYYYKVDKPSNALSFVLYAYSSSQIQGQSTNFVASSSSNAVSQSYDTISLSVNSGSKYVSTSWTNYSTQQGPGGMGGMGGMSEGNQDKGDYSTKGIKANNQITISGGILNIKSYDDAIHANNDETLENGATPLGNITISGGTLTIYSNDDGIHADGTLLISGGTITITNSYEGIEGNIINITGGTTTITASDDGVNSQSSLNVSDGRLDVTVSANGDTDGIDSNGSITITGGIVVTRGPNNQNASPFDADGTIKITGGTVVVIGYCPSISTTLTKTSSSNGLSAGSHSVSIGSTTITYQNSGSYSGKTTVFGSGTATVK